MFVDFDETITARDTFAVLLERFGGAEALEASERRIEAGELSLRDALAAQVALVRGTFDEVAAWLETVVPIDASFAAFAAAARERGDALCVVSSGMEPVVRRRLDALGCAHVPAVANAVDAHPDGWTMRFRDESSNGNDKASLVAAARAAGDETVFVGDGRSDFAAALAAERRFAKRGLKLEAYLRACDAPFESFATFAEVAAALYGPS